jgi:hypothetical protein
MSLKIATSKLFIFFLAVLEPDLLFIQPPNTCIQHHSKKLTQAKYGMNK